VTKTPWLVRGHETEPMEERRRIVERAEKMARDSIASRPSRAGRERALLVYATPALDVLTTPVVTDNVDLLGDSELAVAAERANVGHFDWHTAEAESVRGALTALRGAAGEYWVLERLASGELAMPAGAVAVELMAHHHPGVDLRFTDAMGDTVALANVKVAMNETVVLRHFGTYPDVPLVYATSDAAAGVGRHGIVVETGGTLETVSEPTVVDIGVLSTEFDDQIGGALAGGGIAEAQFFSSFPWFSSVAIMYRAVQRVHAGEARAEVLLEVAGDGGRAGGGYLAGSVVAGATGSPLAGLPAAIVGAWAVGATLDVRKVWAGAVDSDRVVTEMVEMMAARPSAIPSQQTTRFHRRLR
jgi:hypothetical protein